MFRAISGLRTAGSRVLLGRRTQIVPASLRSLRAVSTAPALNQGAAAFAHAHHDEPTERQSSGCDAFVKKERNLIQVDEKKLKQDLAAGNSLERFKISADTKAALGREGIKELFPVQAAVFEHFMAGKDVIVRARTGTGKTIAFALPIVEQLHGRARQGRGPAALVMAPTRELAIQVKNEFEKIAPNLSAVCVYGGAAYGPQELALRRGVDIVVGTPGRLVDHLQRGNLRLDGVRFVVLDEADRMLDQGFEDELDALLGASKSEPATPPQTCMFSATLPAWIRKATNRHLRDDRVTVDLIGDDEIKTAETVEHKKVRVQQRTRDAVVRDLVDVYAGAKGRCIIFTETKSEADTVAQSIPNAKALHGDISQASREVTLENFRQGKTTVLVATDVAARGLDIPEVQLVIQVEPPRDLEAYIHRSGRTGRAGKEGLCITLYTGAQQADRLRDIERHIGLAMTRVGVPQPHDVVMASAAHTRHMLDRVPDNAVPLFTTAAQSLIEEKGPVQALARALAALTGARSTEARSLLDATPGMMTLQVTRDTGSFERVNNVWRLLETVAPRIASNASTCLLSVDGKIAVFDIPARLVADLKNLWDLPHYKLEAAAALPPLREVVPTQDQNVRRDGRNDQRGGDRGRNDRRGGDNWGRNNQRGGDRGRNDRRGGDDWGRNDRSGRSDRDRRARASY